MPQLNHLGLKCEYKSKKLNSVPVVEDGAKRECNDERRMKETVRHMRKNLNTLHPSRLSLFLGIP